jgi:Family of unknown function (DUF5999)
MCQHQPPCPPADALDREAARSVITHPEQGWSLLCNGVVVFEDTGALLPGGRSIPPRRPVHSRVSAQLAPDAATDDARAAGELTYARSSSAIKKTAIVRLGFPS